MQQKVKDPFTAIESVSPDFDPVPAHPMSTRSAHIAAQRILQDRTQYLQHNLPLMASEFIEDHDPEWRDLDYSVDVGALPTSLFHFILQFDWNIYGIEGLARM